VGYLQYKVTRDCWATLGDGLLGGTSYQEWAPGDELSWVGYRYRVAGDAWAIGLRLEILHSLATGTGRDPRPTAGTGLLEINRAVRDGIVQTVFRVWATGDGHRVRGGQVMGS
jgi:hypothetical protein